MGQSITYHNQILQLYQKCDCNILISSGDAWEWLNLKNALERPILWLKFTNID